MINEYMIKNTKPIGLKLIDKEITFNATIPTSVDAMSLAVDGWEVKQLSTTSGNIYYIPVTALLGSCCPQEATVYLYSGGRETILDRTTVKLFNDAEIARVDIVLRPYRINGSVKAYVKRMFVVLEDEDTRRNKTIIQKGNDTMINGLVEAAETAANAIQALFPSLATIKDVIFNDPATIVMWSDGSKTVVRIAEGETFDPEKGLAMAISKKHFGNGGNYYNCFKKWLPKEEET